MSLMKRMANMVQKANIEYLPDPPERESFIFELIGKKEEKRRIDELVEKVKVKVKEMNQTDGYINEGSEIESVQWAKDGFYDEFDTELDVENEYKLNLNRSSLNTVTDEELKNGQFIIDVGMNLCYELEDESLGDSEYCEDYVTKTGSKIKVTWEPSGAGYNFKYEVI
jgi:hypothetical protein